MKKPQRGAAASSCAAYRNARQAGKQHNNGNDKICSLYAKPTLHGLILSHPARKHKNRHRHKTCGG